MKKEANKQDPSHSNFAWSLFKLTKAIITKCQFILRDKLYNILFAQVRSFQNAPSFFVYLNFHSLRLNKHITSFRARTVAKNIPVILMFANIFQFLIINPLCLWFGLLRNCLWQSFYIIKYILRLLYCGYQPTTSRLYLAPCQQLLTRREQLLCIAHSNTSL